MELEKEIQTKAFASQREKLGLNLLFTAGWLQSQVMRDLKPFGISPQQFNVLRILRGQFPAPVAAHSIAARMIDKSSNVSRLIEKLRLKALVSREENPHDRRSVHVAITEKGLQVLEKIQCLTLAWHPAEERVSEADAALVNRILDHWRD
jgi:DNA-binding MarR family transcriptional regulator